MPTAAQRVSDEIDRTQQTNVDAAAGHIAAAAVAPNLKARKQEHDKAADCYRKAAEDLVALAEKREKKAGNTAKPEPASEIWEEAAEIRKAAAKMRTEEANQRALGEHAAQGSAIARENAARNHHRAAYDFYKASEKNKEAKRPSSSYCSFVFLSTGVDHLCHRQRPQERPSRSGDTLDLPLLLDLLLL